MAIGDIYSKYWVRTNKFSFIVEIEYFILV